MSMQRDQARPDSVRFRDQLLHNVMLVAQRDWGPFDLILLGRMRQTLLYKYCIRCQYSQANRK